MSKLLGKFKKTPKEDKSSATAGSERSIASSKNAGSSTRSALKSDASTKSDLSSPLMADNASGRSTDEERAARLKEREERKARRDKRYQSASAKSSASSQSKKKKSKPKLSQPEQDARDAKLGCCDAVNVFLVKAIHFVDSAIGLVFIIWGLLMLTEFEEPAMEAIIACLVYGCSLLFASVMGIVGFWWAVCGRCGLALSAYTAPLIALLYMIAIFSMLGDTDHIFDYMEEHKDVMFLSDAEIKTLRELLPFFYIVLAGLTAIEIIRFFVVNKVRLRLVRRDQASNRLIKAGANNTLADPLLQGNAGNV